MWAQIAVNYPKIKNNTLTYSVGKFDNLKPGDLVEVPLGKRKSEGCVISLNSTEPVGVKNVKEILSQLDPNLYLNEHEIFLYEWMSKYYHYPLGALIFDCLPHQLKRPRQVKILMGQDVALPFELSLEQNSIVKKIKDESGGFSRHLLHGVTGSGKSIIFFELIKDAIKNNKSVLYLLPEINLTPQFLEFFAQHLSCEIVSYHSEISDSEKYIVWKMAKENKPRLFLGVRSSVFLPINNLAYIMVDEEHDNSFKQDDRCTYNARDVATKKAQLLNIPIVLGSATPMVENYYSYKINPREKSFYYELKNRAGGALLPDIEMVDMRNAVFDFANPFPMGKRSIEVISEALKKKEQVIIYVNRLGFSNYLQCRACGHQFNCPNCSVTLRYYKKKNILSCSHCDYHQPLPQSCPECSCMTLHQMGFGTEKVEEVLKEIFPSNTIERFDRDEIKNFKMLKDKLDRFHAGLIDIFVGTQMISKGHNFSRVKTVIILGVDQQLNFPDFRSNERVFQQLIQVAGRAGRYAEKGRVLIQTLNPKNDIFKHVEFHDTKNFFEEEITLRNLCHCPPFNKIALLYFSSRFQDRLISYLNGDIKKHLAGIQRQNPDLEILGPRPSTIEKKANQFTWVILLKSKKPELIHGFLDNFMDNQELPSGISYKIDIDPYSMA
jgi:primosomal protein N' (replication factor Y)